MAPLTKSEWLKEHPLAGELLATNDVDEDIGLDVGPDPGPAPAVQEFNVGRPTKFRKHVVRLIRARVGSLKRSEANRMMLEKVARDVMAECKVRPTQWHSHIPIIIAMFFIPSDAELEAQTLMGSSEARVRDTQLTDGSIARMEQKWMWWLRGWKDYWVVQRPLVYAK